jgi:hypothetical protein
VNGAALHGGLRAAHPPHHQRAFAELDAHNFPNGRNRAQTRCQRQPVRTAGSGGYLPLVTRVSTVRYPIPQRTFQYVARVQSVTDETCHLRTESLAYFFRCLHDRGGIADTAVSTLA